MTDAHDTRRWRGVVAVALLAGALGVLSMRPALLLLSVVGVVFAVYPLASSPPSPRLELERRVDERAPGEGETVAVTVTVANAGESVLPDLRVVDGVPPALSVVAGSPRLGTALGPGESATFDYAVEAAAGRHRFTPATVVARDVTGAFEVETTVAAETELRCVAAVDGAALRTATMAYVGSVLTRRGGSGVEFHGTRRYRPGDGLGRVDWKRFAKTGEHATVEFREERAARVVLLVDAREPAYRGPEDGPHAVAHCVAAAEGLVPALLDDRHRVGVAGVGRSLAWLPPGAGRDQRARASRLLASHETFSYAPPADDSGVPNSGEGLDAQLRALRARLPADAQVLLLSPLLDDAVTSAARRLDARGHPVSVCSPDVTGEAGEGSDDLGGRLAAVERRNVVATLRRAGIPVLDWSPGTPLATAMAVDERRRRAGG